MSVYLTIAAIALLAFLVQGFTGFGSSLILAPLLFLCLDVTTAIVASAIVQIPLGLWMVYPLRRSIDLPSLRQLLPISVCGLCVGLVLLTTVHLDWLKQLCGVLTIFFAVRILLRLARGAEHKAWPIWASYLAGLSSGILGALFGTSGPPVVAYLEQQLVQRLTLRATLLAYFLVVNTLRVVGYASAAFITSATLLPVLVMIPFSLLGAWIGTFMHHRVDDRVFRGAVGMVLLGSGFLLAVGAS